MIKNNNKNKPENTWRYIICLVYSNQTLIFQIVLDFKLNDELFILNPLTTYPSKY